MALPKGAPGTDNILTTSPLASRDDTPIRMCSLGDLGLNVASVTSVRTQCSNLASCVRSVLKPSHGRWGQWAGAQPVSLRGSCGVMVVQGLQTRAIPGVVSPSAPGSCWRTSTKSHRHPPGPTVASLELRSPPPAVPPCLPDTRVPYSDGSHRGGAVGLQEGQPGASPCARKEGLCPGIHGHACLCSDWSPRNIPNCT